MASIYKPTIKDKNGNVVKCRYWRIAYTDETGKRITVRGFKDKAATEAKARELERNAERARAGLSVTTNEARQTSLAVAIQAFLDDLVRRGSKTTESHYIECKRILTIIQKACSWTTLANIRADVFSAYLATMAKAGKAPRTQNRHQETLRNFLNWCVGQKWLEENPIANLRMAPVGQAGRRRRRRAYTLDEWNRLIAEAGPRRTIYIVASLSGLRRSELKRLEKRDVQPMKWTLRADITKNKQAENLPMLAECWEVLQPVWEAAKSPTTPLFASIPIMETMRADLARAGIKRQDAEGRWLDFHSLRYFFCTLLARQLPIQMVKRLMRHRDIRMTCNLYTDLGLEDIHEEAEKLPRLLPKKESIEPKPELPDPNNEP